MVLGLVPASAKEAYADDLPEGFFTPMAIASGFNADGVKAGSASDYASGVDSGGFSFYALEGYEGSFPMGNLIYADSERIYDLADYKSSNMLKLYGSTKSGRLEFASESQKAYEKVGILATGGNAGGNADRGDYIFDPRAQLVSGRA